MDITSTLEAKSSQLNTDDLIAGAKTITITKVSAGNAEQPVAVSFEGDGGKPWYPCKSMRRVLVAAWGPDASQYVGRRVTLFRDPSVIYGGIAVGGIRVSHLSNLDGPLSIALTVTRQKRAPYKVQPLPATPVAPAPVATPPTKDLVAQAYAACRRSGLTDAGIAAFVLKYSQGNTSDLSSAPPEVLAKIAKQGISPQTVEKFNAVPAAAEPDPAPASSQPAPIDTQVTPAAQPVKAGNIFSEPFLSELGSDEPDDFVPSDASLIAASTYGRRQRERAYATPKLSTEHYAPATSVGPSTQPEPTPVAARRVVPQVRRSAPAAPPAPEAPIPGLD
jgi:hypothetical protein